MLSQNNNSLVIDGVGDNKTLQKLILSAKNGDNHAFEKVYFYLFTPLYRYVISRCKNEELSKDVCQQTFLNFYEALSSYKPEKHPLAYLFTIARRLLINQHHKDKIISFDETLLETFEDKSITILEDTNTKLLSEKIDTYLPSLTEDEQEVIRLHFYSELNYDEIAKILDTNNTHIRKIKERALKKLRFLTIHLHE